MTSSKGRSADLHPVRRFHGDRRQPPLEQVRAGGRLDVACATSGSDCHRRPPMGAGSLEQADDEVAALVGSLHARKHGALHADE